MDLDEIKMKNSVSHREYDKDANHNNGSNQYKPKDSKRWFNRSSILKQLIAGTFIIIAAFIGIIPLLLNESKEDTIEYDISGIENKKQIVTQKLSVSDEKLQREIMNLLHDEEIEQSLKLWESIKNKKIKQEELQHIFDYCMQNEKFDLAKQLIPHFATKKMQDKAKKELDNKSFNQYGESK